MITNSGGYDKNEKLLQNTLLNAYTHKMTQFHIMTIAIPMAIAIPSWIKRTIPDILYMLIYYSQKDNISEDNR